MQRLFSSIGEVLAPTFHSDLDDLKNHWKSIKTFYIEKHDDIESFHACQLPGHIISMVSILIEESKTSGEAGPCLEFFLKNRILETLCLLGVHDTPTGVRKLVLQTITILLSDLSLPLLPHMSVHKPICKLIKSIITMKPVSVNAPSPSLSSSTSTTNSEISRLIPSSNRTHNQSNDDSEFVNLLETLTSKLKLYPTLIGFFQDDSFPAGESFILFQGLLKHLWTVGSVGERARKAMVQCLELIPETNQHIDYNTLATMITSPNNNNNNNTGGNNLLNQFKDLELQSGNNNNQQQQPLQPPQQQDTNPTPLPNSPPHHIAIPISSPTTPLKVNTLFQSTPPPTPLKRSMWETPIKEIDDKMDFVVPDPLLLLNHVKFINNMVVELVKIYNVLPKTIASVNYCISGPPIAPENLNILECYKARVSFICALSNVTHNNIGEYITKLWEESFLTDTLGPSLLHVEDIYCATTMLYLREILTILHGPIAQKTIVYLVGDYVRPEKPPKSPISFNSYSTNNNNNNKEDVNQEAGNEEEDDDCIIRTTLIKRILHPNFIVSISTLRLFSTLLGLHNFTVLNNLILVNLPKHINFTYGNYATLQIAQQSITKYLSLFGNKYSNIQHQTDSGLTDIFQNKISSQTNGYSAYLVDARYQISLYSSLCAKWPSNYLFSFCNSSTSNNNGNSLESSNGISTSSSSSITSPTSPVNSNNNNNTNQKGNNYMGLFLESIFTLLKNSLTLPMDTNFIVTGIFSKLCYYPCPQLYPFLVHAFDDQDTDINNAPFPSLYSILKYLMERIEEESKSIPLFTEVLDQMRIHITDITNIANRELKYPDNSILGGLDSKRIDFLHAVIIVEEFCKEVASIIQARVVFQSNLSINQQPQP